MKRLIVGLVVLSAVIIVAVATLPKGAEGEYIRIHIRANSNDQIDQSVKYKIKEKVVEYLSPMLLSCTKKKDAVALIKEQENALSEIALNTLSEYGFDYGVRVRLNKEEFPTRTYGGLTLSEGVYDALIIELGNASGDNWWCVLFPPLCFVPVSEGDLREDGKVVYKSKIAELLGR